MELQESQNNSASIPLTESSVPSEAPSKPFDDAPPPTEAAHNVLVVYVARFDVLQGNTIEWQYPNEFDLRGVEYQAISSGLHRIASDVIYFTKESNVGVSVFKNVASNESERGACMRAIGTVVEPSIETGPSGGIWAHAQQIQYIANRSRFDYNDADEAPYEALEKYYHQHRIQHKSTATESNAQRAFDKNIPQLTELYAPYHHPHTLFHSLAFLHHEQYLEPLPFQESFPFFVAAMGPQVFVLWKAALLRKRILYISSPPLQNTCSHVYNTSLLATVPPSMQPEKQIQTKYAVTVNDIMDLIEFRAGYVACTSDSIFESKTDLFDVLVKEPEKEIHHRIDSSTPDIAGRHNAADFARYRSMLRQIFDAAAVDGFLENDPNLEGRLVECLERKADMLDAFATPYLQFLLWWYRPRAKSAPHTSSSTTTAPSWQRMFAGTRRFQRGNGKSQDISMDAEEQDMLLGGSTDEERDAHEINNNDVFEAVVARASGEYESPSTEQESSPSPPESRTMDINEKLTRALINFFRVLTVQILSGLETILSANETMESDVVELGPRDMLKLGLHPNADVEFVVSLASMYFRKMVRVRKPCSCDSPCCHKQAEGAIRIEQE